MKAVILAAGIGKRLQPYTFEYPKAMVKVKGKPILQKIVEDLKTCGITDIIIVVGYLHEQIERHFGDGSAFGVRIRYVEQKEQLGTGHALLMAENEFGRDDKDFVLVFGDALMEPKAIKDVIDAPEGGVLGVCRVDDPRRFGVIEPAGGEGFNNADEGGGAGDAGAGGETGAGSHLIKSVVEKPEHPPSNLAVGGVFRLPVSIFKALKEIPRSERGEYELPHAYRLLISRGVPFRWVEIGNWMDIGTKEDLEKANSIH